MLVHISSGTLLTMLETLIVGPFYTTSFQKS